METVRNRVLFLLILVAGAIGLYWGWKLFWFYTDDAFIAFRYVSNSRLGYGYTWNPPPFRPVEGYTSFLWVVLLDLIWRLFDLSPPEVANNVSLFFSYLTLGITVRALIKMGHAPKADIIPLIPLVLVMTALLTNRTFLTWTSSGLETALFNFAFLWWILVALSGQNQDNRWLLALTVSATLTYLSRPDGILPVLSTTVLVALRFFCRSKNSIRHGIGSFFCAAPLAAVPIHLLWRKLHYGEWLPNTYYAKYVAPWPEAGVRYLASFILEYGLWVWLLVFVIFVTTRVRALVRGGDLIGKATVFLRRRALYSACRILAFTSLLIYLGYYVFVIGGDHFEYRVFSFLIPLLFLSFLAMMRSMQFKTGAQVALFLLLIAAQLPLAWTHWWITRRLGTRDQTLCLRVPVRPEFPTFLGWYAGCFDSLQYWLISHLICMRHQEHKVFYCVWSATLPTRQAGEKFQPGQFPIMSLPIVGVPGWVLPHVAILDERGLNDFVIARNRPSWKGVRLMFHERSAPPGYLESFDPNVSLFVPGIIDFRHRDVEMTAKKIMALEDYWRSWIQNAE